MHVDRLISREDFGQPRALLTLLAKGLGMSKNYVINISITSNLIYTEFTQRLRKVLSCSNPPLFDRALLTLDTWGYSTFPPSMEIHLNQI